MIGRYIIGRPLTLHLPLPQRRKKHVKVHVRATHYVNHKATISGTWFLQLMFGDDYIFQSGKLPAASGQHSALHPCLEVHIFN